MKVTYKGDSKAVIFDGVEFPQGQAVDYAGPRIEKLKNNRFFDVAKRAPAKKAAAKKAETDGNAD